MLADNPPGIRPGATASPFDSDAFNLVHNIPSEPCRLTVAVLMLDIVTHGRRTHH